MKRSTKNKITKLLQASSTIMEKASAVALVLGALLILTSGYRDPVLTQIAWWTGSDMPVVYTAGDSQNYTAFANSR